MQTVREILLDLARGKGTKKQEFYKRLQEENDVLSWHGQQKSPEQLYTERFALHAFYVFVGFGWGLIFAFFFL